jgi:hypothetical protein
MLTATRDYVSLLNPSYKQLLNPIYTVYLRFLSGQRYGQVAFSIVAPVFDVLSFLRARQLLADGESSGQLSGQKLTVEVLPVSPQWVERDQSAGSFYQLAHA